MSIYISDVLCMIQVSNKNLGQKREGNVSGDSLFFLSQEEENFLFCPKNSTTSAVKLLYCILSRLCNSVF